VLTSVGGVRRVKVAAAGRSSNAYVNVSIQNWQTSEAVTGPVTGITTVDVVVGLTVIVTVEVLVTLIVGVAVACIVAVAVGDPCCPAQAVVSSISVNTPNKKKREIAFILFSPFFQILYAHEYACLK
jgi:hypothetical protein